MRHFCLRELLLLKASKQGWEQTGSCWDGCSCPQSYWVSEGFALQRGAFLHSPRAARSPVAWGGFLQQRGEGVLPSWEHGF